MADVYKCTKVTNLGDSPFSTGRYLYQVDYTDPTTVPPTPGSVRFEVAYSDAEIVSEICDACDAQLLLLGTNEMNWAL